MVTVFLVAILLGVFVGMVIKDGEAAVLALFFGFLFGFLVAFALGSGVSLQTTVMLSQPLERLDVGHGEDVGTFYLEEDVSGKKYIFKSDGTIRSIDQSEAEVVFDSDTQPRVEYVKTELSKGESWKLLFAIPSFSSDEIIFYLPQGTVYVILE